MLSHDEHFSTCSDVLKSFLRRKLQFHADQTAVFPRMNCSFVPRNFFRIQVFFLYKWGVVVKKLVSYKTKGGGFDSEAPSFIWVINR